MSIQQVDRQHDRLLSVRDRLSLLAQALASDAEYEPGHLVTFAGYLEALRDEVTAIAEVERERSNAEFAAEHPEQHATIARLMKPSSPESGA